MLLRPKKCYIFKKIYLFLCLKVIFDTLGSFWSKDSSNFGKVQFCPELSNFSRFYLVLATREDFSTNVRLLYKPCFWDKMYRLYEIFVYFYQFTIVHQNELYGNLSNQDYFAERYDTNIVDRNQYYEEEYEA